jgi:alpha-N-arabinofuranosidase
VLRWPGGCFADEYHWKDGIGPREQRPAMINTHWGGVVENNHFGTHEFLDLCEQLGTEPYISGNVGSGSVQEMMEWVEYITSDADSPMANLRRQNGRQEPWKLRYFGIGNESWGCGGNMRPEFYADLYRQFNTFVKNYGDNRVYRIACGANSHDFRWTEVLMENVGRRMNGLSLHYYTVPSGRWERKGSATRFGEAEWHAGLRQSLVMDELIERHSAIMDQFDPDKRIDLIVDEWGMWHDAEPGTNPGFLYQQNSLRDALTCGMTLNIFNNHADRVKMANIAQTVNVLQAVILTNETSLVLTPTYHVFDLYQPHMDATLLPNFLRGPKYSYDGQEMDALSVSSSKGENGIINITIVNIDPVNAIDLDCDLPGMDAKSVSGKIVSASKINDHNTFEQPDKVKIVDYKGAKVSKGKISASIPAKSVVLLQVN